MKICTETCYWTKEYSWEETFEQLAQAGFDGVDLALYNGAGLELLCAPDYLEQAAGLKAMANACGLSVLQAHAPFGHRWDDEEAVARVVRAIEICGVVEVPILVVHPCCLEDRILDEAQEKYFAINVAYFNRLRPYAEQAGVTLGIENMLVWSKEEQRMFPSMCSTAEEMKALLDTLDGPFTACLDVGHANINMAYGRQPVPEMMRKLGGEYLGCLHIHDNDGISDLHALPLTQRINFDEICMILKEIGYKGHFTYEALGFIGRMPKAVYPAAARLMVELAREWIRRYGLDEIQDI